MTHPDTIEILINDKPYTLKRIGRTRYYSYKNFIVYDAKTNILEIMYSDRSRLYKVEKSKITLNRQLPSTITEEKPSILIGDTITNFTKHKYEEDEEFTLEEREIHVKLPDNVSDEVVERVLQNGLPFIYEYFFTIDEGEAFSSDTHVFPKYSNLLSYSYVPLNAENVKALLTGRVPGADPEEYTQRTRTLDVPAIKITTGSGISRIIPLSTTGDFDMGSIKANNKRIRPTTYSIKTGPKHERRIEVIKYNDIESSISFFYKPAPRNNIVTISYNTKYGHLARLFTGYTGMGNVFKALPGLHQLSIFNDEVQIFTYDDNKYKIDSIFCGHVTRHYIVFYTIPYFNGIYTVKIPYKIENGHLEIEASNPFTPNAPSRDQKGVKLEKEYEFVLPMSDSTLASDSVIFFSATDEDLSTTRNQKSQIKSGIIIRELQTMIYTTVDTITCKRQFFMGTNTLSSRDFEEIDECVFTDIISSRNLEELKKKILLM